MISSKLKTKSKFNNYKKSLQNETLTKRRLSDLNLLKIQKKKKIRNKMKYIKRGIDYVTFIQFKYVNKKDA